VLGIQKDDAELFDRPRPELRQQIRCKIAWRPERLPLRGLADQRSATEFDSGQYLGGFCGTHAVDTAQVVVACASHTVEPAGRFQNGVGHHQGVGLPGPVTQDNGKQLVVTEPCGSETHQLLAWPIVWRDLFHSAASIAGRRSAPEEELVGSSFFKANACGAAESSGRKDRQSPSLPRNVATSDIYSLMRHPGGCAVFDSPS
jgi:hypothetical protein